VLEEFNHAAGCVSNTAIMNWKEQGGRVVGCFCSCAPEEIITAAELLPLRMRAAGSTGTELSDAYMSSINCSFCRHALDMGLKGEFDFVDGLVWLNTCDNVRRIYDNWKRNVDTPFLHILSFPRKAGQPQVEWYRNELIRFRQSIEAHFNVKITDERLWEAIRTHNRTRALQRRLYDLRKNEAPPITGAEMLAVMVAGTAMPRHIYNQMLSELLDDISRKDGITDYRARLMIVGSILDDPSFVKVIEDLGALVVTDSLCFGSRLAWKDVDEAAGDPMDALAKYYVAERPSCPRTFGKELERGTFIKDLVREFRVDGIIAEQMKFCDIWTIENFMLGKDFKEAGIPFLKLDREYISAGVGQLRTRVQAFLETIGGS